MLIYLLILEFFPVAALKRAFLSHRYRHLRYSSFWSFFLYLVIDLGPARCFGHFLFLLPGERFRRLSIGPYCHFWGLISAQVLIDKLSIDSKWCLHSFAWSSELRINARLTEFCASQANEPWYNSDSMILDDTTIRILTPFIPNWILLIRPSQVLYRRSMTDYHHRGVATYPRETCSNLWTI
jgi:hypothetical protein